MRSALCRTPRPHPFRPLFADQQIDGSSDLRIKPDLQRIFAVGLDRVADIDLSLVDDNAEIGLQALGYIL